MQLSVEQEKAIASVNKWYKEQDKQIFRLFGYAGTGKTTLARHFAENIDGYVQFAAFTGKAAHVLRQKGAYNSKTIHSLIYRQKGEIEREDEVTGRKELGPQFVLNRESPIANAKLVIIDECSMVDENLGKDLLSFGVPILVLGDPGQLPPVAGGGFFTNQKPDFQLEQIFRQASDNSIIKLSFDIYHGKNLQYGDYNEVLVIPKVELNQDIILNADQILVGTNRSRYRYNKRIREIKNMSGSLPEIGDKLVCLRNDSSKGLMNGSLWSVSQLMDKTMKPYIQLIIDNEEEGQKTRVRLLKKFFEEPNVQLSWDIKRRYDDFDYGYVLTVHKSQGSQWDNVVLFDESFAFPEMRHRWLYTGITRAAKKIIIVK